LPRSPTRPAVGRAEAKSRQTTGPRRSGRRCRRPL
jgi:hypothetical protein